MSGPVQSLSKTQPYPMAPEEPSTKFGATIASFGEALGLQGLGLMYTCLEPGKRAFPFHNHIGNDEAFVILEGHGTYRFGDREYAVTVGDVCAAPRGGPDTAHQIVNTGKTTLRYLGISTKQNPDIIEYPDSGKFAAMGILEGQDFFSAHMRHVGKRDDSYDYWEGEDL